MISAADVKLEVLKIAFGIKALEEFWYSAYLRGRQEKAGDEA